MCQSMLLSCLLVSNSQNPKHNRNKPQEFFERNQAIIIQVQPNKFDMNLIERTTQRKENKAKKMCCSSCPPLA